MNIVVWGRDFTRCRVDIVSAPFLVVHGTVERQGLVVPIIASHVEAVRKRASAKDATDGAQLGFPFTARSFH
jgi:hypothetical protein